MALHRKKKDDMKMCSLCNVTGTNRTMHGGHYEGRGKRCCDACFPSVQAEENRLMFHSRNQGMSLGEEQAYKRSGI